MWYVAMCSNIKMQPYTLRNAFGERHPNLMPAKMTSIIATFGHANNTWWRNQIDIFSVISFTGGEFTGARGFPRTKASDAELWCFLWSAPEQTVKLTIKAPVIWDAIELIMTPLLWNTSGAHIWISSFVNLKNAKYVGIAFPSTSQNQLMCDGHTMRQHHIQHQIFQSNNFARTSVSGTSVSAKRTSDSKSASLPQA